MAANNDILEMFEMVGTIAVDFGKAIKGMFELENRGAETASKLEQRFQKAFETISRLSASPDIEINSKEALEDIRSVKDGFNAMLDDLKANGSIDFDTDPAVKELMILRDQAEELERSFIGPEGTIDLDGEKARETLEEMQKRAQTLSDTLTAQQYRIDVDGSKAGTVMGDLLRMATKLDDALNRLRNRVIRLEQFITENVNRIVRTTYDTAGDPGVIGPQTTPSGGPQSNGPPDGSYPNQPYGQMPADDPNAYLGTTAAMTALGASGAYAARNTNRFTYDLDRANRALQAYHQRMLRYALQLTPQTALKRATMQLDFGSEMFKYFPNSKNMLMLQATFSAIERGAMAARKQLSQLGFGRTKTEIKAIEGQMHTMANIRLDNLRDQIKLTEKALKEMKNSANSHEFVEEMAEAERALKRYKTELAKSNPVDVIAKANGYKAGKLFGKDVIYKPFDNAMDALAGRIKQFTNRDLAYLQNKTYEALDNAAKAIVGKQTTKAEEKMKINALAMKYQMFGMQLNQFVTPAVAALAVAFGAVANAAQKGWGKFEAQTLTAAEDMKDFKNLIADTSADTGSSIEEVGELFSVLHNQMGRTKENIKESAEWGLQFKKAWGTDAVEAISAVDKISKDLGVTQKEATDILALAMKKHQGDLQAATKDVYKNEDAWRKNSKTMVDGMSAYEKMVSGLDDNGVAKSEKAFRKLGTSLLELWKALEPTVIKLADALSAAADTATEFLRNNPGMATFLAHMIAIGGAGLVLIGVLAPIAGFLLMNRGLFQALGQALGFAGKGMVVMSPQARMLYDNLILTRNAVAGLPRMFRMLGPGILSALRGLPGMVGGFLVQFVKMNPILSTIAALSWVIYKNWDKFEPVLARIWDAVKRIGNVIIEAFAGPGQTGAEGFGKMMDKLAQILGDVLLPIFEALAVILEAVASLMETGAGKYIVYAVGIGMMTGALGKLIPGLGLLSSAFKLLSGNAGKATGAIGLLKKAFGGIGGAAGKMGPLIGRALGGVGGVLGRFGAMLLPLLTNPWVLGIAAIVAVVAGLGYLIYKYWDEIVDKTKQIFGKIGDYFSKHWKSILFGTLLGPLGLLGKYIVEHWDSIASGAKKGGRKIASWFKTGLSGIGSAFSNLGPKLKRGFSNAWGDFKGMVGRNLRSLNRTWSYQLGNLVKALGPIGEFLKKAFTGIFKGFPILAARALRAVGKTIGTVVRSYGKIIASALRLAGRAFLNGWSSAKKATTSAFSSMYRSIGNWLERTRKGIVNALSQIRRNFSNAMSNVRRVVSGAFSAIRRTATNLMEATRKVISGALSRIRKIFSDSMATLRRLVSSGFSAIRRTASNLMEATRKVISGALSRIRKIFSDTMSTLRRLASSAFSAIRKAVSNAMSAVGRIVSDVLGRVRRAFSSAMSYIARTARDAFRSVYNNIKSNLGRAASAISGTFGKIKRYFTGLARQAISWGADVIGGIIGGMSGKAKKALDVVRDLAGDIMSTFKKTMGIASPSRLMRALAKWIPEGVALGINDNVGRVQDETAGMVDAATGDFSRGAKVDIIPEFSGNVNDLATSMIASSIGAGYDVNAQINAAAAQVDLNTQQQSPQFIQIKNMPVAVNIQSMDRDADFDALGRNVQRTIVDNTQKEVNRRGGGN